MMKTLFTYISRSYLLIILALVLFFTSSCVGKKSVVYNPKEVTQLASVIGFPISNKDKNIPLYAEASFWLGTPYKYAGLSHRGVDCSGLVNQIYYNVYRKSLPRSTTELVKKSRKTKKKKLKAGDLVFFATSSNKKNINHVGIYLKDGYFVHSSVSRGVIISHLGEDYYKRTWKRGGRL